MSQKKEKRVFLWCHPRSLSTAFMQSMNQLEKCRVLSEPYTKAAISGEDNILKGEETALKVPGVNYSFVQDLAENDFANVGHDIIFVKDMAYCISPDRMEFFPRGIDIHTFLIRNPYKAIPSLFKLAKDLEGLVPMGLLIRDAGGYRSLVDLMHYTKNELKQPEIVIIDADDLLRNPEGMLRKYCEKTGLPFSDKLLSWEPADVEMIKSFGKPELIPTELQEAASLAFSIAYKNAMSSTCFRPPKKTEEAPKKMDHPAEVENLIKESLPYYQELYNERLII